MSLQATLTGWLLRLTFKRETRGKINVQRARSRVQKLAQRNPPVPKGVTHLPVTAQPAQGLCAAEWLKADQPQTTLVYFHGGGYFFCGLDTHRPVCAYLAKHGQAQVLSVDYRMAPEHVFPAAVDDAVAWWEALLNQGTDPSKVVFGGDSAGGGLTLATLIAARDKGLPMPAGAFLFSPWTDLSCSGDTMKTMARADVMFDPQALPQAAAFYLAGRPANTPLASPLFADLKGLPPLMIHASEHEVLLDDSRRLHAQAQQQGVLSELHLKPRMPHVWPTMVLLPEARESLKHTVAFIQRVTRR
ncbi:MAG: alpha/beta hydrolase [Burkholderiales bacterium]|nr:alpha/beta hydrolase [Burkholderiales bacterium]MDE2433440.1 alpha/beta hydrolase [Burkholderiales bacterium]